MRMSQKTALQPAKCSDGGDLLLEELLERVDGAAADLAVECVGVVKLAAVVQRGVAIVRDADRHL